MDNMERGLTIARLIAKKHTEAGLTPDEERRLDDWLKSPDNKAYYDNYPQTLASGEYVRITARHDTAEGWRALKRSVTARRLRVRRLAVAASVAVVAVVSFLLVSPDSGHPLPEIEAGYQHAVLSIISPGADGIVDFELQETAEETDWQRYVRETGATQEEPPVVKISVPRGGEYKLRLGDGSVVWLNSESALEYPAAFTGTRREVKLTGEAYFEVAKDDGVPFVVAAKGAEIVVTGTSFNVAAYEADDALTATLVSGSVNVVAGGQVVGLTPGKQAVVPGAGGISVTDVDADLYTSWTRGVFEFDDMRLRDICERLARWYDVEFVFDGGSGEEKFSGGTWKYVPLNEFLENIELVTDVRFRHKGGKIHVIPLK